MAATTITLPYNITNGSANDASQVMADLNAIVTATNANFADAAAFSQSVTYPAGTVGAKLKKFISVTDAPYGAVGDWNGATGVDNTASFQAAVDALGTVGGMIRVPAGSYKISGQVVINKCSVVFVGDGYQMNPVNLGGTYLIFNNAALSPFALSQGGTGDVRGSEFRDMALMQIHPAPAAAWTPTIYPAVFSCLSLGGEFTLRNIFAQPIYDLVSSDNSGRLNIITLKGQVFHSVASVDRNLDSSRFIDFHLWPYWSAQTDVLNYVQSNCDVFAFKRVDTPFLDNIFCYGVRSILHAVAGGAYGTCSGANIGTIANDAAKYGLWIESDNFTANIANLFVQGETVPAGTSIPVIGAYGIFVSGANAIINIGNMLAERYRKQVINVTGGNSIVTLGAASLRYYNYDNDGSSAVTVSGAGSQVVFASYPYLTTSNGERLTTTGGVVHSTRANTVANQVNELRSSGAATGGAVSVAPVGSDANVPLYLQSKGTGDVRMVSNGQTVVRVDQGVSGASDVLMRSQAASVDMILEGSAVDVDLSILPKGAGALRFGTYAAGIVAQAGYITIKDAGGTLRRLLVG